MLSYTQPKGIRNTSRATCYCCGTAPPDTVPDYCKERRPCTITERAPEANYEDTRIPGKYLSAATSVYYPLKILCQSPFISVIYDLHHGITRGYVAIFFVKFLP